MDKKILFFLCTWVFCLSACVELVPPETIGEGECVIRGSVEFRTLVPTLSRSTRSSGTAIESIHNLWVLLYDENGQKVDAHQLVAGTDYTVSYAPGATASFSLKVPYGRYYIYAAANVGEIEDYAAAIQTVDGLKSISFNWDVDNVGANSQMFGHFKIAGGNNSALLTINKKSMSLHADLERAASKVTVAYDGSELKDGVFIYLQSVQIKDIPYQCYLGKDNNVGGVGYALGVMPQDSASMLDGEIITYHEGDKPEDFEYGEACAGHRITVGSPYFGSHDETAPALYFYENMQGAGESMPDKRQDANGDGVLDRPGLPGDPGYKPKDDVPYGTYIEVQAHYISNNPERLGNGHIVYRFMLGQDVINDYNARRNCHYKLTLKFKNFANEADWHIEYREPEPGVMVPEPYYISYLYNHSMVLPVKVSTGGYAIKYMKAEIIDNRWAPHNADPRMYYAAMDLERQNRWNGFLSLHETTETIITGENTGPAANQSYYEKVPQRGVREYTDFTPGDHTTTGSRETDIYRVEEHPTEKSTYTVYLPLYTRAKQMIPATGYTGNNPYVAYQRKAVVRLTTKLGMGDVEKEFVNEFPIYQVRRIVNPKGIYRSSDNSNPFHVVLRRLPREEATEFVTFQSEGPWKAYIVKGENYQGAITLEAGPGSVLENDRVYGQVVYGQTGSVIDFNVNFTPGNEGENRYAVIRVEYHNFTCQHLIFIRQGNAPDQLIDGGALWYAENMRTRTARASSPLDEGSLFKRCNWDYPIDALNNKNPRSPWTYVDSIDFKLHPADGFTIAGTNEIRQWNQITATSDGSKGFAEPTADMRVATYEDYNVLKTNEDIEQGYGVLYGDDATECAVHIDDVYGYDHKNNNSGKGMRGVFVYNKETGKNLFFPIGASGYGHRKGKVSSTWADKDIEGVLRYAGSRSGFLTEKRNVKDKPLFYDLFKRPGAIYWVERQVGDCPAWDINYFTFGFDETTAGGLNGNQDACFIRCVVKK